MASVITSGYPTTSEFFAAYLYGLGYPLLRHEADSGGWVEFFFKVETIEGERLRKAFDEDTVPVAPQTFIRGIREIRQIIRREKEKREKPGG